VCGVAAEVYLAAAVAEAVHALRRCTEKLRGSSEGVGRCGVPRGARGGFYRPGPAFRGRGAHGGVHGAPAGSFPIPRRRWNGSRQCGDVGVLVCSRRPGRSGACRGAVSAANLGRRRRGATAMQRGQRRRYGQARARVSAADAEATTVDGCEPRARPGGPGTRGNGGGDRCSTVFLRRGEG